MPSLSGHLARRPPEAPGTAHARPLRLPPSPLLTRRRWCTALAATALAATGCTHLASPAPAPSSLTVTPFGPLKPSTTADLLHQIGLSSIAGIPVAVSAHVLGGMPDADALWLDSLTFRYLAVGLPPGGFLLPWNQAESTSNAGLMEAAAPQLAGAFTITGRT